MNEREIKPLSERQLKVGEAIKRELMHVLQQEMHEAFLDKTSVIISEVRMSPDLKLAKVYLISMIGSTLSHKELIANMTAIGYKLKKFLSKRISLRSVPELNFYRDESFEHASHINSLLKR